MANKEMKFEDALMVLKLRRDLLESDYQTLLQCIERDYRQAKDDLSLLRKLNYQATSIMSDNSKFRVNLTGVLSVEETVAVRKIVEEKCHDILGMEE